MEERAGALIAATSRGSPIRKRSAGDAVWSSTPLQGRDETVRCPRLLPLGPVLSTSAFVSLPQVCMLLELRGDLLAL